MRWGFRLIRTQKGVAVHHVYWTKTSVEPVSCGAVPFVAEAADIEDLRFLIQKILDDAFHNPVLDGSQFGFSDGASPQPGDNVKE